MITVIIPNFNGIKFIQKCLKSIPLGIPVIIIDNASSDGSNIITRKNLKLIQNEHNLGFAASVNKGIEVTKTKYVQILNNDVILEKNFFTSFTKLLKSNPNYFCYCPTVLDTNNQIENTGLNFNINGKAELRKSTKSSEIWGAPATACTYKTKDLKNLKGFDPSFFAYIEDVDLHFRANQQGLKTYYSNKLVCTHYGGGTAGKHTFFRAKYVFINWIKFIIKNYTKKQILQNLPGIIIERLKNFKYLLFCIINDTR